MFARMMPLCVGRYTLYDDAKECTFRPTLQARGGGKRGGEEKKKDDDEAKRDKEDAAKDRDAFGFLDRQVRLCPAWKCCL